QPPPPGPGAYPPSPPAGQPPSQPPGSWPPQPGYPGPPAGSPAGPPLPPGATPTLRLRPLSFGELLDDVFRVYRRHFWLLVSISLVVALPTLILQILSGQADQLGFSAAVLNQAASGSPPQSTQPPQLNFIAFGLQYIVAI